MKKITALFLLVFLLMGLSLPAAAAGDGDLVMSNCDTTQYWSANSQGADALTSDSANKTEGAGSVGATAINGKLNQIAFVPEAAMDVSQYAYMEFDIYFRDLTWFSDCGSVMFELTSSGECDKQSNRYMKKVMRTLLETGVIDGRQNWWHFVLELDNPQDTANGKLSKAGFNFFRFYSVDPISTTPDYTMRIDNIHFTNNPENYTPLEDEEDSAAASSDDNGGVYVPKPAAPVEEKSDPDLITIIVIGEAVLVLAVLAVLVVLFIKFRKKGKKNPPDNTKGET